MDRELGALWRLGEYTIRLASSDKLLPWRVYQVGVGLAAFGDLERAKTWVERRVSREELMSGWESN